MESNAYHDYAMTNADVGEALFLHKNTIPDIEKRALAKMRKMLEERGIRAEDILLD
jgi:DNA-directed RNA polymerase sigma subunit (sigma70/sigma32)